MIYALDSSKLMALYTELCGILTMHFMRIVYNFIPLKVLEGTKIYRPTSGAFGWGGGLRALQMKK